MPFFALGSFFSLKLFLTFKKWAPNTLGFINFVAIDKIYVIYWKRSETHMRHLLKKYEMAEKNLWVCASSHIILKIWKFGYRDLT